MGAEENELVEGTVFDTVTVELDNKDFLRCTFRRCVLKYSGGPTPGFKDNEVEDCIIDFDGAAHETLATLTSMLQGGFAPWVERVFEVIRNPGDFDAPAN